MTNELFAVCRRIVDEDENGLSGVASSGVDPEIGPLNIPDADVFTLPSDISFNRDGVLNAHILNNTNLGEGELSTNVTKNGAPGSDLLGSVDTFTGQFKTIGQTGFSNLFSAIAFSLNNLLYHAGGDDTNLLNVLDGNTGAAGVRASLQYPDLIAEMNNTVASMDTHTTTGQLFAVIFSQDIVREANQTRNVELEGFYLTTIDPRNGRVEIIGHSVDGLTDIAFLNEERAVVPALSDIGMTVMALAFLGGALFVLRRRQQSSAA